MRRTAAYEKEPYRQELETVIVEVGEEVGRCFAVPADTVLYPEGGGQPSDTGWVNDVPVTEVRRVGGRLRHFVTAPVALGPALVKVDWPRRFDHMQQHTAQHLLTSLAQDRFGWATTAFHLGEETSDVELDVGGLSTEQLPALEEAIAVEIRAARRVTCCRVGVRRFQKLGVRTRGLPADHRGTVRLVEIRGLDLNTCGGTHLRSTAELESVKLLGTEPMRGGTRVYFAAGGRARRIFQAHERRNAELRSLLGAPDSGLTPAVASRLTQIHELQHHQRMLREELVAAAAEALASHPGDLVDAHFRSGDAGCLERIARQLLERAPQKAALLTGGADSEGFFVVVAGEQVVCDVQALGRQVALLLGGRGGGSGRIFQGRLSSLKKRKDALGLFMVELERD